MKTLIITILISILCISCGSDQISNTIIEDTGFVGSMTFEVWNYDALSTDTSFDETSFLISSFTFDGELPSTISIGIDGANTEVVCLSLREYTIKMFGNNGTLKKKTINKSDGSLNRILYRYSPEGEIAQCEKLKIIRVK